MYYYMHACVCVCVCVYARARFETTPLPRFSEIGEGGERGYPVSRPTIHIPENFSLPTL